MGFSRHVAEQLVIQTMRGSVEFARTSHMHPAVLKLIIMLAVLLVVIRFGFRFFFSGALLTPLGALLRGLRRVDAGGVQALRLL